MRWVLISELPRLYGTGTQSSWMALPHWRECQPSNRSWSQGCGRPVGREWPWCWRSRFLLSTHAEEHVEDADDARQRLVEKQMIACMEGTAERTVRSIAAGAGSTVLGALFVGVIFRGAASTPRSSAPSERKAATTELRAPLQKQKEGLVRVRWEGRRDVGKRGWGIGVCSEGNSGEDDGWRR